MHSQLGRIPVYLFTSFPENKDHMGILDEYIAFSHNVTIHMMKCLFDNNESGHHPSTASQPAPTHTNTHPPTHWPNYTLPQPLHPSATPPLIHSTSHTLHLSDTPPLRHSTSQTLHLSDTPPLRHSTSQTLHLSDTPPLRHSTPQTLHPSDTPPLRHSTPQTLHPSDTPPLRHSTPQTLHPSDTPPLRHSTPQTLHPSDTPPLRHSTAQTLHHSATHGHPITQSRIQAASPHSPHHTPNHIPIHGPKHKMPQPPLRCPTTHSTQSSNSHNQKRSHPIQSTTLIPSTLTELLMSEHSQSKHIPSGALWLTWINFNPSIDK